MQNNISILIRYLWNLGICKDWKVLSVSIIITSTERNEVTITDIKLQFLHITCINFVKKYIKITQKKRNYPVAVKVLIRYRFS